MRPILPLWAALLLAAILFMAGLFWVRAHPGHQHNPLEEAVESLSRALGMEVETVPTRGGPGGLLVTEVLPGSPAERAGVQVGERVVAVGDRSVWHAIQLQELISADMMRRRSCTLMLAKDPESQRPEEPAVRVYRTVTLGFAPVAAPAAAHEHSHQH